MIRLTGPTIRRNLRALWAEVVGIPYEPAFTTINAAQQINFERSSKGFDGGLLSWIQVVDEVSFWLASLSMALEDEHNSDNKRDLVCRFMIGGLSAHMNAVRTLVIAGFDVPAKMLVRQIEEHCSLLILLMDDAELCSEFHHHHEPEASNKFWHKHISKGKLEKKINEKLKARNPELSDAVAELGDWLKEERLVLSAASHPSFLASAMTVAAGASSGRGGGGVFGFADAASARTLRVLFYHLFLLMWVQQHSFQYLVNKIDICSGNPFGEQVHKRRDFVYRLMLFVAIKQDELPLQPKFIEDEDLEHG
ncbi:hypothetical protein EPK99_22080 [Neorhizobium lilium]|uniref:Uncharacterized protein n=1 Tax=Neorhizobium lilium TaxID=2503024 RepID=A0A3S4UJC7_9HYPH|nr:hypothetical protein [Neorhizobium lilium]RWX75155.1 hypothetical protein EPK99_22080 [Neorhizobium lilium]